MNTIRRLHNIEGKVGDPSGTGSTVGLPEGPAGWGRIVGHDTATITGGDLKREGLAVEVGVGLPVLPPVPRHGLPTSPGPFDGHTMDVTGTTNVGYED